MKPQRPYLFDAIYRWVLDNGMTPYLLVDARNDSVIVPQHLVKDGQIVLNICPDAIANYFQSEDRIQFSARFSGQSQNLLIPFSAMLALYARESSQGIVFPPEDFSSLENEQPGRRSPDQEEEKTSVIKPSPDKQGVKKPGLKVIK